MSVWRTKSIEQSIADTTEDHEFQLKRRLTALDLTLFGIGVIIGAGIFTTTGRAAHELAGPAVVISFAVGAVCCGLAALCYAELASAVPVSGSAYTFSYATLGELIAWIIGWDLFLELMLGASVVAQGWSQYFSTLIGQWDMELPSAVAPGSHFDLMAFLLVVALTTLIAIGIKESLRVNMALVALKLFIVLFVIVAGIGFIDKDNYTPFIPEATDAAAKTGDHRPVLDTLLGLDPSAFGLMGIFTGAALVFFAYIGFDVVATTAEEAKNPQRDLPIGIIASLVICTILYVAVSLVITGMVNYKDIDPKAALATAFTNVGKDGYATIIAAGAVAGLATVVMTLMIGATRVIFAMSRDNLLPRSLAHTNPRTGTPVRITLIIGTLVALITSLTPIAKLEEMVNIGTLSAFALVSIAIPVLRKSRPDLKRSFKVPFSPWLPIFSALVCTYLMLNLSIETWLRFLVWMALGFLIYFVYSRHHAKLGKVDQQTEPEYFSPEV